MKHPKPISARRARRASQHAAVARARLEGLHATRAAGFSTPEFERTQRDEALAELKRAIRILEPAARKRARG